MKALLWKEFRENLKWALLLALLLGGSMAFVLHGSPGTAYDQWSTICSEGFLTITTFGFALAGLALGFLQILPEQRKDRWAFWIHRPVSSHELFLGKVLSGTALYALATILPLTVAFAWCTALSWSVLPFTTGMILPGLIDALTGLCLYFAAFLTGLLPGRWYGARALPLVAAFVTVMIASHVITAHVGWLSFGIILGLALFIAASWAAFLHNGKLRLLPLWGKAPLGFIFATACLVLVFFLIVVIANFFRNSSSQESTRYEVENSGRVVRTVQKDFGSAKVFDLEGNPLPDLRRNSSDGSSFRPQTSLWISKYPEKITLTDYRRSEEYFVRIYDRNQNAIAWFYDQQRRVFVGYHKEFRKVAGYLGRDGIFSENWDPSRAFPSPLRQNSYTRFSDKIWVFSNEIYWVDPLQQRVNPLLTLPGEETFEAASQVQHTGPESGREKAVIATSKGLYLIPSNGNTPLFFPHPPSIEEGTTVNFVPVKDDSRFLVFYNRRADYYNVLPLLLIEFDAQGKIVSEMELPNPAADQVALQKESQKDALLFCALMPPVSVFLFRNEWKNGPSIFLLTLAGSLIASIISAGIAFALRRRMDLSAQALYFWTPFIVCTGIYGLLASLILEGFPRRIPCPACGKKRFLHQAQCQHCHTAWPQRKPDGTEVIDPVLAELSPSTNN
jgi:hypothetical protein